MRRATGMRGIMVMGEGKEKEDKMPIRRRLFQSMSLNHPLFSCKESGPHQSMLDSRISIRASIEEANH